MKKVCVIIAMTIGLIACGSKTVKLTNVDKVPAAEASLTTDEGDNGMVEYEFKVKHLAPANKVEPNASSYVVWIQPISGTVASTPQNVGPLSLNKDLSAKLDGQTPFKSFKFFVTAEPDHLATFPEGEHIFESTVAR